MNVRSIKYGNTFCAVEHAIDKNFCVLQLKKKKKELSLLNADVSKDFESLLKQIGGQKHLSLVINHEKVLTKQIDTVHTSKERIVKLAFPNIAIKDFYYDVFDNGITSFVSICRQEEVHSLLNEYAKHGISVIRFTIGFGSIIHISSLLNSESIQISNARFVFENGELTSVQKESAASYVKYDINGLRISSSHMLSLGAIIAYYSNAQNDSDDIAQKSLMKTYEQKRTFQLGIRFALGFLFLSLLINFLLFSNYRQNIAEMQEKLEINKSLKKQLTSLDNQVNQKKKLLESMNSVSSSKVIWYFDEISKTVPKTVSLTEVNFQPLVKPPKKETPILFRGKEIIVKGVSKDNIDFTNWITKLESFDWIDKVSFVNYGRGKKRKTTFDFLIVMNGGV